MFWSNEATFKPSLKRDIAEKFGLVILMRKLVFEAMVRDNWSQYSSHISNDKRCFFEGPRWVGPANKTAMHLQEFLRSPLS